MRALLTATFLLATLLSTTPLATAAPPDILTPTDPPEPQPCEVRQIPCDMTTEPSEPPESSEPATTTTTPAQREAPQRDSGTEADTGTAAGPARTSSAVSPPATAGTDWWLIAVPVLALLALAAVGAFLLVQRSERRPS